MGVQRDASAPGAQALQRLAMHRHQRVAGQHQVGRGGADAGGTDVVLRGGDEDVAPGRAALLRQPRRVLRDDAAPFEVGGHPQQLADGDDPGAAHAGHHDAPGLRPGNGQHRLGQRPQCRRCRCCGGRILLAQLAPFDRDEAGAETLEAAHVLVATALVDAALAAECGLQRFHRQAVALHTAIAAALAHQFVDDHPLCRVDGRTTLAAAAFFGGAGLVVDEGGGAGDLAQLALDVVEQVTVQDPRVAGDLQTRILFGLVGHDHHLGHALGPQALGDLRHAMAFGPLTHRLAAGHGDRVVVEDLVGDVHPRGHGLADGHQPAVEVGAVAQVGEDVAIGGEGLLANPGHALAAHLGEARRAAVHPGGHVVAADAGDGTRALGHHGAGVVRATRTVPGRPVGARHARRAVGLHGTVLGVEHGHLRFHAGGNVGTRRLQQAELLQAPRDGPRDEGGRQVGVGAQQRIGRGVGHAPFAAGKVTLGLVELAQHVGPHVGAPVVELLLQLVLDDLAFFLHHQDLLQAGGEGTGRLGLQRPYHTHLVQADADLAAGGIVQAQLQQRLARVVPGLAAGDDAEAVPRTADGGVVQPVGPDVGQRGVPLVVHEPRLLLQRRVGPADVQAAGRHLEILRHGDLHPLRVDHGGGAGLDDFLDRLHAGPEAGEAAHGEGVDTEVQDFLHAGREEHRQAAGLEDVIALVRRGAALGHVVVARHGDDTAERRGARHVGVLEHIGAAVHPRALAVPDAEHPVVPVGTGRRKAEHLRAPQRGRGQFLVDAGLEDDVLRLQELFGLPQRLVVAAQG